VFHFSSASIGGNNRLLSRFYVQHLRDDNGKQLSPYEYVLEHTGEDARVVVMPISSSTAAQIVKDAASNGAPHQAPSSSHDQNHHSQLHYNQSYVMSSGYPDLGSTAMSASALAYESAFVKREELNGPSA
jgi:hypothetical protein